MVLHPADMRLNYALRGLDEADLHPDPIEQFKIWFEEARRDAAPEGPVDQDAADFCQLTADSCP